MRFILREGRLEDLKAKNPLLSSEIDELTSLDPSGNLKYLDWEVKQLKNGFSVNDIVPTVQIFHKKQGKFKNRDINAYKTLKELEDEAKELELTKTGSEVRKEAKAGADTVYEDDDVIVKFIPSKEASCQYGKNTKWCITMRDHSFFEQYSGANVVFYFAMRKKPLNDEFDKVAIVVMKDKENRIVNIEFYDAIDAKHTTIVKPLTPKIIDVAKAHAAEQPKGLLAKIKDGDATEDEEVKTIELYPDAIEQFTVSFRSKKALTLLAKNEDLNVRWCVAENPNAPSEILAMLAKDKDPNVRMYVAKNPNTLPDTLTMLVNDRIHNVRTGVAVNKNVPTNLLLILSDSESSFIRQLVAEHPSTPQEILKKLANDESGYVRQQVAKHTNTPADVLEKLAHDSSAMVRGDAASNVHLSEEILEKLASDNKAYVRYSVAGNLSTPIRVLKRLVRDSDRSTSLAALDNMMNTDPWRT